MPQHGTPDHSQHTSPFTATGSYTHSPDAISHDSPSSSAAQRLLIQQGNGNGHLKRDHSSSHDQDGQPSKKPKNALSCSECKRRKIKCDRKIPCEACIKRGKPETCTWEEAKFDPAPQPFALVADVNQLTKRLADVEAFLQTLPPELRAGAPRPPKDEDERNTASIGVANLSSANVVYGPEGIVSHRQTRPNDLESDMEDAAIALETIAFTTRAGSNARKTTGPPGKGASPPNASNSDSMPAAAGYMFGGIEMRVEREVPNELTKALTCIVGPTLVVDNPVMSASSMGLGICTTAEQVLHARREALDQIFAILPTRENCEYLVNGYFRDLDWLHHVTYEPSLRAEVKFFYETLCAKDRWYEVDPAWLAVYVMILALAIDGLSVSHKSLDEVTRRFPTREERTIKAMTWFAACQRLLELSDYRGRPQVRTIQAVLLMASYIQTSSATPGEVGQTARFLSWLSSAIRTAQILNLHQLGEDPETMPPEDAAWPPGKNSVKREGALRLFTLLTFMDYMSSSVRFRSYMLLPDHCSTPPLSNLNYSDLSPTEWRVQPKPRATVTDASFEFVKFQIAAQARKVFDMLIRPSTSFSYETVLELDRGYRRLLDSLPTLWLHEHGGRQISDPHSRWKRHICHEGIHSRIMRLHRPFLTRGYAKNSRFAYSTEQCVKSAKLVIISHSNLLGLTSPSQIWFVYAHALAASIVLFADLFYAIDTDMSEQEIDSRKDVLVLAVEIFGTYKTIIAPTLRSIVQKGSRILSGLFLAEEKRRATRAARTLSPGQQPPQAETFAQVLMRLSSELDLPPAPMPPTPAQLSRNLSVGAPVPAPSCDAVATSYPNQAPSRTAPAASSAAGAPSTLAVPSYGPGGLSLESGRSTLSTFPSFDLLDTSPSLSAEFFRDMSNAPAVFWGPYSDPSMSTTASGMPNGPQYAEVLNGTGEMTSYLGFAPPLGAMFDTNGSVDAANQFVPGGQAGAPATGNQMAANVLLDQLATFF